MCGIFGYLGNQTSGAQIVLEGLKKLEYRGYDSWGIALRLAPLAQGQLELLVEKHIGKISNARLNGLPQSNTALGHTRWATHGGVSEENAHPHLDCTGKIAVIHNGIIENYDRIKKNLLKSGHKFVSNGDSEVVGHLIEEYLSKMCFKEAFRKAFLCLSGLNAVIALDARSGAFLAAKTGSPLVVGLGKEENFLASDAQALLSHTRQVHFIQDNELVELLPGKVNFYSTKNGKVKKPKIVTLDWEIEEAFLGKYPHFMIKEIMEQPKVIGAIAQNAVETIPDLAKIIKSAFGTYIVGCGSASYACLAGTYLFSRIAKKHVNFALGSEFGYALDFLTPKSLVIALSQSGETMDIIESVAKTQKKKAKVLAIVNSFGSTLYRMGDYKMLLGAGPEKSVLATKSVTAQIAVLLLLAYSLDGGLKEGNKLLSRSVLAVNNLFKDRSLEHIKKLASLIANASNIYIVGRGQSYPIAMEAALKIKEVTYIHAEGFAAGELKHGVIALIEKGTPCIVFAPLDETFGAVLSGAMEMKARGGFIIGISPKNHEVFDYHIPVSDCGEATMIPNVVVAQLLAYYLALKLNRDPDKPRNLAKSVTVK
ncbi:MAG: glutamine--fructose-6-phosphate transaminase (isomerizing) [bacterium]|nr:glutamine--fructose-6-phosphate transaminase (isomerizing) [bacterium]